MLQDKTVLLVLLMLANVDLNMLTILTGTCLMVGNFINLMVKIEDLEIFGGGTDMLCLLISMLD